MENQPIARGLTLITGEAVVGKTLLAAAMAAHYPAVTKRGVHVFDADGADAITSKNRSRINGALKMGEVIIVSQDEDFLRRIGFKKRAERHIRIDIASELPE